MCCRATVQSKEKELEAQRSRVEQQEKHEARAVQEREALGQQHAKAEDAAHRQVGQGWYTEASSSPTHQPLQPTCCCSKLPPDVTI